MWDFLLVLGRVPGTDFVITFSEVIGFSLAASFFWLAHKKLPRINPRRSSRLLLAYILIKKGEQLRLPL